ncbi:hypothetical protein [Celeribacter sp.]|uniref:hypothetical protein n=1 Tax=Celeribacter sp. TaxID=1890673 RepID=UPI003A934A12
MKLHRSKGLFSSIVAKDGMRPTVATLVEVSIRLHMASATIQQIRQAVPMARVYRLR